MGVKLFVVDSRPRKTGEAPVVYGDLVLRDGQDPGTVSDLLRRGLFKFERADGPGADASAAKPKP